MKRALLVAATALAAFLALRALVPGAAAAPAPAEVSARVQAWQLTEKQCAYQRIRWTEDVPLALERSRETGRPVLMFYTAGPIGHG